MRHKVLGILSLLFVSLLFAVPASATLIPACGPNADGTNEFVLVAQDQAIFEGSDIPRTIEGNLLVTGPAGLVKLGKNITITGTVTAHKIEFHSSGTSGVTGKCVANVITGNASAGSAATCAPHVNNDFDNFETAHPACVSPAAFATLCSQGGPAPAVDNCVNGKPALIVPAGSTKDDLLPGCHGALVLENGAVLNLDPGAYRFSSVRMKSGSRLNGPATVNVNGQFITEPGVFITDINLNTPSVQGDVIAIFNNSVLTRVVINAPFGRCHPHTGTALECTEICCKTLDIEPISAVCDGTPGAVCVCQQGFKFVLDPQTAVPGQSPISNLARDCEPCGPNDHPPAFPTCN